MLRGEKKRMKKGKTLFALIRFRLNARTFSPASHSEETETRLIYFDSRQEGPHREQMSVWGVVEENMLVKKTLSLCLFFCFYGVSE